jgi:hypothetical protein
MNRCLLSCVIGLTLMSCAAAQDGGPRHPKFPRWITDYQSARKMARETGKPLFIVLRCEP